MTPERMYQLAAGLGAAKNRQDVAAALTFMHDDIELTSPAWGAIARGKAENAALLTHFFANYPDYEVSFEGYVADGKHFVGWGGVRMTMAAKASDASGMLPNGRLIAIPVTIRMTFKEDLIATEHFMCDLAQIATQSGISIDGMWKNIFGMSPPSAATQ
ncbi:nuclear transport factor 2 family protein [Exilibacterium tricleocarpae]|uniref:Nuclear transport factor 2 family protein n=1 Tax=Exilibacterium tricleocarpae TaxID=2591008 RepID=A0A545TNW6_9GAMM|nr:nuclear transport factor 2 family protein [Exilibacterium tricleocarpae]TQV78917.1 nuclear transport factor 2 family protein [Exilibacterium tricleocarpae]